MALPLPRLAVEPNQVSERLLIMAHRTSLLVVWILFLLASLAQAGEEQKVIIGFHHTSGLAEHEKKDRVYRVGGKIRRIHSSINAVAAQLPEEAIVDLKKDPHIAYVEADSILTVVDPIQVQTSSPQEYADSWGVQHIGADVAAMKGYKGAGAKVAILDTGIDYNHPDLKDNYKGGYNFVYENNDPIDDSRYGHGTHLAGIIAAKDNGTGVVGVAPEASLYAVKVLNGGMMGSTSDILAGIEWAIINKMNVINMSFGAPMDSQAFRDSCDMAYKAGIILIAAAGNFNQPIVDNPAGFDSVVAVSATAQDDSRAPFSNYGTKVELSAPGVAIKSTVFGGGYGVMSGTSQAVPHVAGVAALIVSAGIKDGNGDGNTADDVRRRLTATSRDLGDPGRDMYFGYGLVDAAKAVDSVQHYTVTITGAQKHKDALKVTLKPGTYSIEINNNGLKALVIRPSFGADGERAEYQILAQEIKGNSYESEEDEALAIFHFKPNAPQKASFVLKVSSVSSFTFTPYGKPGTSADIGIQ